MGTRGCVLGGIIKILTFLTSATSLVSQFLNAIGCHILCVKLQPCPNPSTAKLGKLLLQLQPKNPGCMILRRASTQRGSEPATLCMGWSQHSIFQPLS